MKKIAVAGILVVISISIFLMSRNIDRKQNLVTDQKYDNSEIVEKDIENSSEREVDETEFIRTDSQGSVDVGVLFKNLIEDNNDYIVFEIMFNTHSVDLDKIDFAKLAKLKNDKGLIVDEGFHWEKIEGSGHHIFGNLTVSKKYKGKSIIGDKMKFIELEINGLDGVESRRFIWKEDILKNLELK